MIFAVCLLLSIQLRISLRRGLQTGGIRDDLVLPRFSVLLFIPLAAFKLIILFIVAGVRIGIEFSTGKHISIVIRVNEYYSKYGQCVPGRRQKKELSLRNII